MTRGAPGARQVPGVVERQLGLVDRCGVDNRAPVGAPRQLGLGSGAEGGDVLAEGGMFVLAGGHHEFELGAESGIDFVLESPVGDAGGFGPGAQFVVELLDLSKLCPVSGC